MKHVFGPVPSRRLGRSLGIDPIPLKTCNWNCVYCQLGRSRPLINERKEYVPADEIIAQVKQAIAAHPADEIDWVTFVGSGEPLLHARIGMLIRRVKEMTEIPVAVLTNGGLLYLPEVREELSAADAVLPTLDAGSLDLYLRLNRPHPELTYEHLVEGLAAFRSEYAGQLWLEVMLVHGMNDTEEALRDLALQIHRIRPDEIHINLPERPPVETWVRPPTEESLRRAVEVLGRVAPIRAVEPGRGNAGSIDLSGCDDVIDAVIDIITRHPLREEDLVTTLDRWAPGRVREALTELEASGRAQVVIRYGKRYWTASPGYYPDARPETGAGDASAPASYSVAESLRDGEIVRIRAIRPADKAALVDLFRRLSPQSIYYRFHGVKKRLTSKELVYLTELDFRRRAAVVAVLERDGVERIAGVGRYACAPNGPDDRADVAVTVEDSEQRRGIGSLLLDHLARIAAMEGIETFRASALSENFGPARLFERSGRIIHRSASSGVCHFVLKTGPAPPAQKRVSAHD